MARVGGGSQGVGPPVGSTLVICQAEAPPPGLVEVSTLPTRSIATHNDAEGHATPIKLALGSTSAGDDHDNGDPATAAGGKIPATQADKTSATTICPTRPTRTPLLAA